MASFADLRPIIIICCVSGFFLLFLGWVSAETPTFLTGVNVPVSQQHGRIGDMFSSISNGTWTYIDHDDGWTSTGTISNGSISIKLYTFEAPALSYDHLLFQVDTFDTVGGFLGISWQTNFEHFIWYTNSSKLEQKSVDASTRVPACHGIYNYTLDVIYAASGNNMSSLRFYIANSRAAINVQFAFNSTTYANPSLAWLNDALAISFDAGYSETPSSQNTLSIITGLLFWSIPGIPSWLFALVDLAFFAPIIYVAAIWILRIIGSIAGGGASG